MPLSEFFYGIKHKRFPRRKTVVHNTAQRPCHHAEQTAEHAWPLNNQPITG